MAGCTAHQQPDAAIDAPVYVLRGRYLDWDSSSAGSGCGIAGATVSIRGDASRTTQTLGDGRFELGVHVGDTIDIVPPSEASSCSAPSSTYRVPGVIPVGYQVPISVASYDVRAFTDARTPAGYDSTKTQVLVHMDVHLLDTIVALGSDNAHDPSLAFDGSAWAPGSAGEYVYFPNVTSSGTISVFTVNHFAYGGGNYPDAPGAFIYAEIWQ